MKPIFLGTLAAALAAPLITPAPTHAQAMLAGATVIHCSELPGVLRTAPANAVVQIHGTCTNMALNGRTLPITILATGQRGPATIIGLRMNGIRNLTWIGGTIEAIGGLEPDGNWINQRGLSVDGGENLSFSGVTFRHAMRAAVFSRSNNVTVANSLFTRLLSDGINLGGVQGAVIRGNRFENFSPRWSTCWRDGVRIGSSPISRSACTALDGTWRDGDHPDCLQMWNWVGTPPLRDILVAQNVVHTPGLGACQGLTMHGTFSAERVRFLDNTVRTDNAHGIALVHCTDCEVRGNLIEGIERFGLPYITQRAEFPNPGTVACNNRVITNHPLKTFGTQPCS